MNQFNTSLVVSGVNYWHWRVWWRTDGDGL